MPDRGFMSKRAMTPEIYAAALAAFREQPGQYNHAARMAGIDQRTASRLWNGPPYTQWPWAKPIAGVLADENRAELEERTAAEAQLREEADAEQRRLGEVAREAAKLDEGILRTARSTVLRGLAALSRVAVGADKLAERIGEELARGTDAKGNPLNISPRDGLRIIKDFSAATKGLLSAFADLKDIDRLNNGQPTAILGVSVEHVTLEQLEREFSIAEVARNEARRRAGAAALPRSSAPRTFEAHGVTTPDGEDDDSDEDEPDDDGDDGDIPGSP
jgi:hypothetical protein